MKKCPECNVIKSLDDYWKDPYKIQGIETYCKICSSKRKKKYYSLEKRRKYYGNKKHLLIFKRNKDNQEINALLYRKYFSMYSRCRYKRYAKNYSSRGIILEWKCFADFKKDMLKSFTEHIKKYGYKNTTIDRIDNNGNYCKENCRWASMELQQANRRVTRKLNVGGVNKPLTEWCKIYKIEPNTVLGRIKRGKNTLEALTTPPKVNRKGILWHKNRK